MSSSRNLRPRANALGPSVCHTQRAPYRCHQCEGRPLKRDCPHGRHNQQLGREYLGMIYLILYQLSLNFVISLITDATRVVSPQEANLAQATTVGSPTTPLSLTSAPAVSAPAHFSPPLASIAPPVPSTLAHGPPSAAQQPQDDPNQPVLSKSVQKRVTPSSVNAPYGFVEGIGSGNQNYGRYILTRPFIRTHFGVVFRYAETSRLKFTDS